MLACATARITDPCHALISCNFFVEYTKTRTDLIRERQKYSTCSVLCVGLGLILHAPLVEKDIFILGVDLTIS